MAKKQITAQAESDAEAWKRFERAVDVVAKSPPQPKTKIATKKPAASKNKPPEQK